MRGCAPAINCKICCRLYLSASLPGPVLRPLYIRGGRVTVLFGYFMWMPLCWGVEKIVVAVFVVE